MSIGFSNTGQVSVYNGNGQLDSQQHSHMYNSIQEQYHDTEGVLGYSGCELSSFFAFASSAVLTRSPL